MKHLKIGKEKWVKKQMEEGGRKVTKKERLTNTPTQSSEVKVGKWDG